MALEQAAKSLRKSMKGIGTDEKTIIQVICSHSNRDRQEIKKIFKAKYDKNLEEELKSEIGGRFLQGVLALLMPVDELNARALRDAMNGIGTDEELLIEILCTREGHEIQRIASAYKFLFNSDLATDIKKEQGSDLGKLLRKLAQGQRPQTQDINYDLASQDAEQIYKAGEGKLLGTDEDELINIFCTRSYPELRVVFDVYSRTHGDIEEAIKSETSGDFKIALNTIIKSVQNRPGYYARLINSLMKGIGTKDDDLIRVLVSRSEIDLHEIKLQYEYFYDRSLHDAIKSDLTGDYEKLFLTLIK